PRLEEVERLELGRTLPLDDRVAVAAAERAGVDVRVAGGRREVQYRRGTVPGEAIGGGLDREPREHLRGDREGAPFLHGRVVPAPHPVLPFPRKLGERLAVDARHRFLERRV